MRCATKVGIWLVDLKWVAERGKLGGGSEWVYGVVGRMN